LDHQNNYIERLNIDDDTAKSFNISSQIISMHNPSFVI